MKYIPKTIFLLSIMNGFYLNSEQSLADNSDNPPNGIEIDNVFQTPEGANSSVINRSEYLEGSSLLIKQTIY